MLAAEMCIVCGKRKGSISLSEVCFSSSVDVWMGACVLAWGGVKYIAPVVNMGAAAWDVAFAHRTITQTCSANYTAEDCWRRVVQVQW